MSAPATTATLPDLKPLLDFLPCRTPAAWLDWAQANPDILLIDHAHCEKKAASTALNLLFRYVERSELLGKMAQLAREELLHFEQVLDLLHERGIHYQRLPPSRYAGGLRQHVSTVEPQRLVDILLVGSLIEARSCERFLALSDCFDARLARYYRYLLKSESRHFELYLSLARLYSDSPIDERLAFFKNEEKRLIESEDTEFRFHSGVPPHSTH